MAWPEDLVQPNTLIPTNSAADILSGGSGGEDGLAPMPLPSLPVMAPTPAAAANPWQDVARMLQGFAAGVQGRPNPVIALEQRQQALEQELARDLANRQIQMRQYNLQERREQRLEESQKNEASRHLQTLRVGLAKTLLGMEGGEKAALGILRQEGVFNLPEGVEADFVNAGLAKNFQSRLDSIVNALDAGVDPKAIGVPTAGINIEKLQAMTPEQRQALASPDYQKKALDAAEKRVELSSKALVAGINQRLANGEPVSFAEKRIAGLAPKSMDEYATEIVMNHYADPKRPMSPLESQVVNSYLMKQRLGGITGEAAVAMRAAAGDKDAQKAFAMLNQEQRRMTAVELVLQAGMIRAKMETNPTYAPTLQERGILAAADMQAEQKAAKPLPQYLEKRFSSMRAIGNVMNDIDDAIGKGGLAYVGPVAGRAGKLAETIGGPWHDKVRSQMYTAVDTLFAEIGPEKFGGQFTGPEQTIVRDFKAELTSPSGQFSVRHEAFRDLMRRKYEDSVKTAKANKYRLPEDFEEPPEGLAGKTPQTQNLEDKAKQRAKALFLEGKTPQQVREQLRKEGF